MGTRNSLRGRVFQYDDTHLYHNDRIVGEDERGFGNTFYVDSGVDALDGRSPKHALGTLDEAFAKCTADQGDKIVVLPGHSETITGVGGIAHDVAGVSVIGLGHGSQRPTFLMDGAATVTYLITANDALVRNLVFNSGHSDVVACIQVTDSTGVWIDQCEFGDNTTAENFLTCIKAGTLNNTCDDLRVTDCVWSSIDAGSLEFIETTDDVDRLVATGNFVSTLGTASPLIACATGDLLTDAFVAGNFIVNKNTSGNLLIDNDGTSNTGIVAHNRVGHLDTAAAVLVPATSGFRFFDNLGTSALANSGVVNPAIDTI